MARWFWLLVAACAALFVLAAGATLLTDAWWFASLELGAHFRRVLALQAGAAAVAFGATLVVVGGSARIAASSRRTPRVRRRWEPFDSMGAASAIVTGIVALGSAAFAAERWPLVALAVYGGSFGWREPVFGLDAGFYVFVLPLITTTVQWLFALFIAGGVVSVAHYVGSGTVRVQLVQQDGQLIATGVVMPPEVKRHFATLCAGLLLLYGALSFLGRYSLMSVQGPALAGPGYADLYGTLPMLLVQTVGAAVAAVAVVVAVGRGSAPGFAGAIALVVTCRLLTAVVPGALQRLVVVPAERSLEGPQIAHHVAATRTAWDLDTFVVTAVSGTPLTREDLDANGATLWNLPLWAGEPLLHALNAKQAHRDYYRFLSAAPDRYEVDGAVRQVMVAPRELIADRLEEGAQTWVNRTMTYTHGYGVAVSRAGGATPQGGPRWLPDDALPVARPELYFGEGTAAPVTVGTTNPEFDHAAGDNHEYDGADGVPIGSVLRRIVFAMRLWSPQLLLSRNVTRDSEILLHRNVVERVARLAPMFQADPDPYVVVHEGRLVWMLDGYTHTDRFPYAAHVDGLGAYARGAVKATVDAYDGTVRFYRTDVPDPIADAWARAFPGLLAPLSEMPIGLRAHLRYPERLFAAQARLFGSHHGSDPRRLRQDAWRVPVLGTGPEAAPMAPLSTLVRLPGEAAPEFTMTLPLALPENRGLAGWVAARSDEPHYGELVAYTFPAGTSVPAPANVLGFMDSAPEMTNAKAVWKPGEHQVSFGPLLAVPVEGSLLYVRAAFAAKGAAAPELKRVLLAHEEGVVVGLTLEEAVGKRFGAPARPAPPAPAAADPRATAAELVHQANQHWVAADAAARRGDWSTFGVQMSALGEVMSALEALTVAGGDTL